MKHIWKFGLQPISSEQMMYPHDKHQFNCIMPFVSIGKTCKKQQTFSLWRTFIFLFFPLFLPLFERTAIKDPHYRPHEKGRENAFSINKYLTVKTKISIVSDCHFSWLKSGSFTIWWKRSIKALNSIDLIPTSCSSWK